MAMICRYCNKEVTDPILHRFECAAYDERCEWRNTKTDRKRISKKNSQGKKKNNLL